VQYTACAVDIHAAEDHQPPRVSAEDVNQLSCLFTGAQNQIDDDVSGEPPEGSRRLCQPPAVARDVQVATRERGGRLHRPGEHCDLMAGGRQGRHDVRPDEPGCTDE
jgi:hypothetical protein